MRQPLGVRAETAGSGPCDGRRSMPRLTLRNTFRRMIAGLVDKPGLRATRATAAPAPAMVAAPRRATPRDELRVAALDGRGGLHSPWSTKFTKSDDNPFAACEQRRR